MNTRKDLDSGRAEAMQRAMKTAALRPPECGCGMPHETCNGSFIRYDVWDGVEHHKRVCPGCPDCAKGACPTCDDTGFTCHQRERFNFEHEHDNGCRCPDPFHAQGAGDGADQRCADCIQHGDEMCFHTDPTAPIALGESRLEPSGLHETILPRPDQSGAGPLQPPSAGEVLIRCECGECGEDLACGFSTKTDSEGFIVVSVQRCDCEPRPTAARGERRVLVCDTGTIHGTPVYWLSSGRSFLDRRRPAGEGGER